MMTPKNIFFDLDGTIIDSHIGILHSIKHGLKCMHMDIPSDHTLKQLIGPPLLVSLKTHFHLEGEKALETLEHYRIHYNNIGVKEYQTYENIEQVLDYLIQQGYLLFIATGKPTKYAQMIIDELKYNHYFTEIAGSNLDNTRTTKVEVIEHLLSNNHLLAQETVIVGDRVFDIEGGKRCGLMNTVGVTYGFGSREELEAAGADIIVDNCYALKQLF